MNKTPALASLVLGLTLTLTLSGCGGEDPDGTGGTGATKVSATEHNDADVAFATDMIQHHAQALAMVDMTVGRDLDPEVAALTEDIRSAQGPEIETMVDWLMDWGEEIPETVRDHANAGHGDGADDGMDHGDMGHSDMPGMTSAEDMSALEDAPDAEFEDMWLEMMIEHHQGAVEMAETEQGEGQYEPAVDLAGDIVDAQSADIETMEELL